ncbi:MAG: hypothetical protein U9P90_01160 [Patescibacteria group bacterium]|nr:hypothetical protein [Patescibacteria group bacterium]
MTKIQKIAKTKIALKQKSTKSGKGGNMMKRAFARLLLGLGLGSLVGGGLIGFIGMNMIPLVILIATVSTMAGVIINVVVREKEKNKEEGEAR